MTVSAKPEPQQDWLQRNLFKVVRTSWLTYALLAASLVTTVATYLILTGSTAIEPTPTVRYYLTILLALFLLALASLVIGRFVQIWHARRSGAAGARLHGRLVTIFSLIAVIPVVLTAGAAAITINLAMEAWFSGGVRSVVDNSLAVTNAYFEEHTDKLRSDALNVSSAIDTLSPLQIIDPIAFGRILENIANRLSADVLVVEAARDGSDSGRTELGKAKTRFTELVQPTIDEMSQAAGGAPVLTTDYDEGQIRAVAKLSTVIKKDADIFLVLVRNVNPQILEYQRNTDEVVKNYNRLEKDRDSVQLTFILMYGIVALVVLFTAAWIGLGTANRIVMPIGRLIGASERVSEGDLSARVTLADDDDELASLGRAFNRMTGQLQSQRNELVESNRQADQRRRFTEAVLSGVSAGVVGLNGHGHTDIVNRSALNLLSLSREDMLGRDLAASVPEVNDLVVQAMASADGRAQAHIDITRNGNTRNLSVTVTRERASEDESGYVVTFDDITDLISAQRTSAWADVARRIAHEIKNPLTPIQLSAERLRRKYKKEITTDPEIFEQCTQTIIRQVGDIGRMVDEFSSFARMPQPVMKDEDICEYIKHAVFLQRVANPQITFALLAPEVPVPVECDGRLVSQALTNVLKNAGEAVRARFLIEGEEDQLADGGRIEIRVVQNANRVAVDVIDNGVGLPTEDRNRLTEPYVTKRAKGTGLGLAIVKKIMEDHKGTLTLEDAPKTDETGALRESGALVRMTFPRLLGAMKLAGE
ncbi:MAG: PAS domain-containing sensor histidine kinase [Alphaproteobacteria bacterium]|nr:PAS domain-containing sensor histidine kinase [Alphaproteobacteria bacterium]